MSIGFITFSQKNLVAPSDDDFDIVHSGKVIGTVPVGAGDSLVGSVQADASGSKIIVIIISQ